MDEVIDLLESLLGQAGQIADELSAEEMTQVLNVFNEAIQVIQEQQQIPPTAAPLPLGADLLWILAGGKEDAFIQYLRTYPNPSLNALASNPAALASTIDQLSQRLPQGAPESKDGVDKAPINSSNIYGFKYDPKTGRLLVRFQSGSVYGYIGVPAGVFKVFQQGAVPAKTSGQNKHGSWWIGKLPSLGAAFYEMIRNGGYPYQRLS